MITAMGTAVTGSTFALFSDTELSNGNTFTAGTMDLMLFNGGNPVVSPLINFQASDGFAPGTTGTVQVQLHNGGSTPGTTLSMQLNDFTNHENGRIEPEIEAGDVTDGDGQGELQNQIMITIKEGATVLAGPVLLSTLTNPITISGGLAANGDLGGADTRDIDISYEYVDSASNNLSMSDLVTFSLQFALGQ